jgi:uncharacterized protein (UPF0333 family)
MEAHDYPQTRIMFTFMTVFFHDISSSYNGGAICCDSNVYKLLVEQSSFFSCKTSAYGGGGVYFSCSGNYECVMSKICGFGCSCGSYGQCAYISLSNSANHKNHFNDSTITHSLKDGKSQCDSVLLRGDTILVPSNNFTNNECHRCSALSCHSTRNSTSETCIISYCSVVNNTANGSYQCIRLYDPGSTHRVDTYNIINNKQTTTGSGTIYASTNILIKDSCILGNNEGSTVFYVGSSSFKITVSNCTVDNNRYSGSVIFTKTAECSFIHALSHIVTRICDSNFDSYGTFTVKPNIPSRSSRCLLSCNNKRPMFDGLIIIQFILFFGILPSDPLNRDYFNSNFIIASDFYE